MRARPDASLVGTGPRSVVGAEVLVIDKDPRVRDGVVELLSAHKMVVTVVDDPMEAWSLLDKRFFSVVVIDLDTPVPNAGIESVASVLVMSPTTSVVALTPRKSYDDAIAAIRAGASDVVFKSPDSVDYLKDRTISAAASSLEKRQLHSLLTDVRDAQETFLQRFIDAEKRTTDLEDKLAGRDTKAAAGAIRLLIVSPDETLAKAFESAQPAGYHIESALAGGEALDRCSSGSFHMLLCNESLPDLPTSMVLRSARSADPELLGLTFRGPGPNGTVRLADASRLTVIPEFTEPTQLFDRLDELAEAFRAKERERRYTQAFRERHYDFVRKYVRLKEKIDRALSEASF